MRTMRHVGNVGVAAALAVAVLFFAEPVCAGWVRSGNYIVEEGVDAGSTWKLWVNGTSGDITISYSTTYKHTAGTNTTLDLSMPVADGSKIVAVANYALRSGTINFTGKPPVERIVLPSTLKTVGDDSFTGNASLREVTPLLPDSVTNVGTKAFQNLAALTGALSLGSVTSITSYAFQNTGVSSASLLCATNINSYAFSGCSSLTNVAFGDRRVSLGQQAFAAIAPHAILRFPTLAPYPTLGTDALKGSSANPYLLVGSLAQDPAGWAACTNSALTSTDKAHAYYPGLATFGILVSGGIRNWLVDADSTNWFLTVTSNNGSTFGTVTPAYGMSGVQATGTVLACSATSFVSNGILYRAVSYVWEDLQADFTWGNVVTNSGNAVTNTQDACSHRLTWLWQAMGYPLTTVAPGAATSGIVVDPLSDLELGCYTPGTLVTLIAQPGAGETFTRWLGDLPASDDLNTTVTVTLDKARTLVAAFSPGWVVTPNGSSTTLTDGNWVLKASLASSTNLTITGVSSVTDKTLLNLGAGMQDASGNFYRLTTINGSVLNSTAGFGSAFAYLVLPEGLTTIGTSSFSSDKGLRFVRPFLPSSVTYVGQSAFDGCTALTGRLVLGFGGAPVSFQYSGHFNGTAIEEAILGEGVTTSPSFQNCTSLTNLIWHDSITGCNTFSGCSKLVNVTPFMPKAIRSIGQQVFNGVPVTNDLEIGFGGVSVSFSGNLIFSGIKSKSIKLGSGVTAIGDSMFYSCSELQTLELPEGLTKINAGAFSGCGKLKTVTPFLPPTLTSIGNRAFDYCPVDKPLSITGTNTIYLGPADYNNQGMFTGCSSIPCADLTGGITNIPGGMFLGGTKLGEIRLSKGVMAFNGTENFKNCTSLTNVYFLGTVPSINSPSTLFSGVTDYKVRVYVPRSDAGWGTFEAANVTPLNDTTRAKYQQMYPADTQMPCGVWTISGKNLWFFYWTLPKDRLNGTLILVH